MPRLLTAGVSRALFSHTVPSIEILRGGRTTRYQRVLVRHCYFKILCTVPLLRLWPSGSSGICPGTPWCSAATSQFTQCILLELTRKIDGNRSIFNLWFANLAKG